MGCHIGHWLSGELSVWWCEVCCMQQDDSNRQRERNKGAAEWKETQIHFEHESGKGDTNESGTS